MKFLTRIVQYTRLARRVKRTYGVSYFHQLSEILHLSRSPGRIGPGDYYSYRLFEKNLSMAEKKTFVGWKAESRIDSLNEPSWHCLGLDKVLMYSLFHSNDILFPQTRAIYLPGRVRPLAGAVSLTTKEELYSWLRNQSNYPFFSKPSASGFARGAFLAANYDGALDSVLLRNGREIKVEDFEGEFHDGEKLGYLFQKPIEADDSLVDRLGEIVSSLRIIVLVDESHPPVLHRCFWKLPTGSNTHDNYGGGRTGNLAAAIDHQTGAITRVINGSGLDVVEVTHHPDTHVQLDTLSVPNWSQVVDFTFKAALVFPKLRFQQWDIALSNEGPMAMEVNLYGTGGEDLTQLLYQKGLLDTEMESFLGRHKL